MVVPLLMFNYLPDHHHHVAVFFLMFADFTRNESWVPSSVGPFNCETDQPQEVVLPDFVCWFSFTPSTSYTSSYADNESDLASLVINQNRSSSTKSNINPIFSIKNHVFSSWGIIHKLTFNSVIQLPQTRVANIELRTTIVIITIHNTNLVINP